MLQKRFLAFALAWSAILPSPIMAQSADAAQAAYDAGDYETAATDWLRKSLIRN